MNAAALIEVIADIIKRPGYTDASLISAFNSKVLAGMNASQLAIADEVCLPDLADGLADITATTGAMYAAIPTTFHKKLFLANNTTTGEKVEIFSNIGLMAQRVGLYPQVTNEGDVIAVAVHADRILYQQVPTTNQTISLMFYRRPVAMTISSSSYPDGLSGSRAVAEDAFDRAIIHRTAWKWFERVEQGVDGRKIDTEYHKNEFRMAMLDLSHFCVQEEAHVYPLANRCW